jgi:hypothetical protein
MRADWIAATSSTGGTGDLALTALAGSPGWTAPFSGVRIVDYTILEFTDSTQKTIKQIEHGFAKIDTSGPTLKRSTGTVKRSWDGTNYLPNPGSSSTAAAIGFGTVSANILITCAPSSGSLLPILPAVSTLGDNVGVTGLSSGGTGSFTLVNQQTIYVAQLLMTEGQVTQAAVRVNTAYTGGTSSLNVALYELDTTTGALPGRKLADFGNLGALTGVTTIVSAALATPFPLGPGWYVWGILPQFSGGSGTPALFGASPLNPSPFGVSLAAGTQKIAGGAVVAAQTSLTDPATTTAIASAGNIVSPLVFYK